MVTSKTDVKSYVLSKDGDPEVTESSCCSGGYMSFSWHGGFSIIHVRLERGGGLLGRSKKHQEITSWREGAILRYQVYVFSQLFTRLLNQKKQPCNCCMVWKMTIDCIGDCWCRSLCQYEYNFCINLRRNRFNCAFFGYCWKLILVFHISFHSSVII